MWNKARVLEAIVRALEGAQRPDADFGVRAKVKDRATGRPREVDVLVEQRVGGEVLRIGIECRYHDRKVDVQYIEQVVTKRADLTLDRIHVVSVRGFTAGAKLKARHHGVLLSCVEDLDAPNWSDWVLGWNAVKPLAVIDVERLTFEGRRVGESDYVYVGINEPFEGKAHIELLRADRTRHTSVGELVAGTITLEEKASILGLMRGATKEIKRRIQLRGDPVHILLGSDQMLEVAAIHALIRGWREDESLPVTFATYNQLGGESRGHLGRFVTPTHELVSVVQAPSGEQYITATPAPGKNEMDLRLMLKFYGDGPDEIEEVELRFRSDDGKPATAILTKPS